MYQIVSVAQTSIDLSFLVKNDLASPIFKKLGTFELFDNITDACLLDSHRNNQLIDQESQLLCMDKVAIGLESSLIIAIVQYNQIIEDFQIVSRIRLDLDMPKILAPYDRLFSYNDELLFGFPRIGGFKIWKFDENVEPKEVELTYK
mgnify:CR=1 FL=1